MIIYFSFSLHLTPPPPPPPCNLPTITHFMSCMYVYVCLFSFQWLSLYSSILSLLKINSHLFLINSTPRAILFCTAIPILLSFYAFPNPLIFPLFPLLPLNKYSLSHSHLISTLYVHVYIYR